MCVDAAHADREVVDVADETGPAGPGPGLEEDPAVGCDPVAALGYAKRNCAQVQGDEMGHVWATVALPTLGDALLPHHFPASAFQGCQVFCRTVPGNVL